MELALVIYLIDVICGPMVGPAMVIGLSIVTSAIVIVSSLLVQNDYWKSDSDYAEKVAVQKRIRKCSFKIIAWCVALICISTFIPSKDTAYKMLAAYGISEAAKMPEVQKFAGKSLQVLEGYMDEYIDAKKKEK